MILSKENLTKASVAILFKTIDSNIFSLFIFLVCYLSCFLVTELFLNEIVRMLWIYIIKYVNNNLISKTYWDLEYIREYENFGSCMEKCLVTMIKANNLL